MLKIFKQYYPIRNIFFVIGEFLVIYASGLAANRILLGPGILLGNWTLLLKILLITWICQICLYYNDLYDFKITDSFAELSTRLLQALGASAIILAGVYTVFPHASMGLKVFVITIIFDILFIVSWRMLYTLILNRQLFDEKIILLGSGELSRNIFNEVRERRDCGYVIAAVFLENRGKADEKMRNVAQLCTDASVISSGNYENLCATAKHLGIKRIVVALEDKRGKFPTQELLKCRVDGIEVLEGTTFYEMLTGKLIVDHINPAWLIFSDGFRKSRTRLFVKRSTDLFLSFFMLIFLSPLFVIISILIKADKKKPEYDFADVWRYFKKICSQENANPTDRLRELMLAEMGEDTDRPAKHPFRKIWQKFKIHCSAKGKNISVLLTEILKSHIDQTEPEDSSANPVFFSQERMGRKGKKYRIHKFRSMIVNAERFSGPAWACKNDKRITRIGNFIRKWRIDEIPQLWNVLKGEMSFVGPRPEREHFVRQLEQSIPYFRERLSVKPGITGWAQVCYGYGASENDAKEKLNYDLFYIKNMSIAFDLMIVLRTIKIVIFGKGR
ncbi:MAG: sugar transferase [Desulfobacterales bacterium]